MLSRPGLAVRPTGRSERWVRDQAARAIAAGYLARVAGTGHHGTNTEYIAMIPVDRLFLADTPEPHGHYKFRRLPNGNAHVSDEAFRVALAEAHRRNTRASTTQ